VHRRFLLWILFRGKYDVLPLAVAGDNGVYLPKDEVQALMVDDGS
jgi:hypothetical protein